MVVHKAFFRWVLLVLFFYAGFLRAGAQTPEQIIASLRAIHKSLSVVPCDAGKGMLISNKAMNIFLSNKVSSYLSAEGDLSLYKNDVLVDAVKGTITINHNLHQPDTADHNVKSFTTVGAKAGFANAYAARLSNSFTDNQLGFTIQEIWMGKPLTRYNTCGGQKQDMDAQRALMVKELSEEITEKANAFEKELAGITAGDLPGQDLQTAKVKLSQSFYSALKIEYLQKFSAAQSDLLINTNEYNAVTDDWTILSLYLPVIPQKFQLTNGQQLTQRYNYPLGISATHTWFWDAPKVGRIFLSVGGDAKITNSAQDGLWGGVGSNGIYTGTYSNYLTPDINGKLVYIPPDSHVGISFRLEKNYGNYQAINGIVGIPIVLIDKKGVPAVNFECQLLLDDINHSLKNTLSGNRTAIGLTVGIPFSKIVY